HTPPLSVSLDAAARYTVDTETASSARTARVRTKGLPQLVGRANHPVLLRRSKTPAIYRAVAWRAAVSRTLFSEKPRCKSAHRRRDPEFPRAARLGPAPLRRRPEPSRREHAPKSRAALK